jgi:hypothetical protein
MEIFYWIIPYFLTVVCLIPFCIGGMYFVLGIQNLVAGNREKNPVKIRSGYKAVFISLAVMGLIFFAWYYYGGGMLMKMWT